MTSPQITLNIYNSYVVTFISFNFSQSGWKKIEVNIISYIQVASRSIKLLDSKKMSNPILK